MVYLYYLIRILLLIIKIVLFLPALLLEITKIIDLDLKDKIKKHW